MTKFCKVCQDAGKTEKEYTSHFTRAAPDVNAKITCPTLLAQQCRYCEKLGHTVKYCTVLQKQKKQNQYNDKTNVKLPSNKIDKKIAPKLTNNYNIFNELEDEVVPVKVMKKMIKKNVKSDTNTDINTNTNTVVSSLPKEQDKNLAVDLNAFPCLPLIKPKPLANISTISLFGNYKSALEKPLEPIEPPINIRVLSLSKPAPWVKKDQVKQKSWADYDSEEDDDETTIPEKYVANDAW